MSLFCTGCSFFHAGQNDVWQTTEADFEQIDVRHFAQNRLTFEGIRNGESSVYTYDMHEKTLTRNQGSVGWANSNDSFHYLGAYGKVTLQKSEAASSLILKDQDGNEKELVQVSAEQSLGLSVSPNRKSLLYWAGNGSESDVYLYDLERDEHAFVNNFSGLLQEEDVSWSGNSKYVMLEERQIYRVADGAEVMEIEDAAQTSWSPVSDELLVLERDADGMKLPGSVEKNYAHRIVKYDVFNKEKEQLFPRSEGPLPLILDEIVWGEQGRFFAFVTGSVNGEQVYYRQVHVMDPQGGFHHVENEQNARPFAIEDITFSPNGDFLSYTANGLLKVLYIPTQKSKVFDVYTQNQAADNRYLVYNRDEAWVMAGHEVRRLMSGLEEKSVYRSDEELLRFFVANDGESLLVIERKSDQYALKLVSLLEQETEAEAN
ncbi:hypothetical protein [Novibacillus thermophilus]|uniref:hypothetical protein n=1 Tax=Novibacillus thermophilus TaxID=1471761 RepID=UPI0014731CF3|nr:hypothetical protein [Novibacillus thermophilus]